MIDAKLYDAAQARLARDGWSAEVQTSLSLLLAAAKQGNAAFHAGTAWLPMQHPAQQFLLSQGFRESEALVLLTRITAWSSQPDIYWQSGSILAPLNSAWAGILMSGYVLGSSPDYFRGIALGHAALARIRLTPLLPAPAEPLHPYQIALMRIEQENSRLLQTQIRLLKHIGQEIPLDEREAMIEEAQSRVDDVFANYLQWFANNQ